MGQRSLATAIAPPHAPAARPAGFQLVTDSAPSAPPPAPEARSQWQLLAVAGLAAASLWGFFELAGEVTEGETRRLDEMLLLALRTPGDSRQPLGPVWLWEAARDVTALGSVAVLTLVTAASLGFLLWTRRRAEALLLLLAVPGGGLAMTFLKRGFDRPRPELVPHMTEVITASFPSGHAMLSAVVYLTLGVLLARTQTRLRIGAYLIGVALCLTVLVGISRVYLGVHWPSDVLAGWVAGSGWAASCWLGLAWLQRRAARAARLATGMPGQHPT